MAGYKVLQDIEAEDKLLGPLSLRQCLYAVVVIILGFIAFQLFVRVHPLLVLPFLPPMALFGVLAAPFGTQQSSEIWLLAKIRFALKPHLRIWDQAGQQELVTVTAPKVIEKHLTNGLDTTQIRSRLQALAQTIDTHGWATKGVSVNLSNQPQDDLQSTDRLVSASILAQPQVADIQIDEADDILDVDNNPLAQQVDQMIKASGTSRRKKVLARMDEVRNQQSGTTPPPNPPGPAPTSDNSPYQFTTMYTQTVQPAPGATPVPAAPPPPPTLDDQLLLEQIHNSQALSNQQRYGHTRVLEVHKDLPTPQAAPPTSTAGRPAKAAGTPAQSARKGQPIADILDLASNDDLNVATIARQANRTRSKSRPNDDNEVVISLH